MPESIPAPNVGRAIALALIVTVLLSATAMSAPAFRVWVDRPQRTLDTGAFTTFEIHAANLTGDSIAIRATRVVQILPDTAWYTSICSFTICYPEEISQTGYEQVGPGDTTGFAVHVMTGPVYGDTARVTMLFEMESGGDTAMLELAIATARPPVAVFRVDPVVTDTTAAPGETVAVRIWAHNLTDHPQTMRASVIDDYFPDAGWSNMLCTGDSCSVLTTGIQTPSIEPYHTTWFDLRIHAGAPGRGRVVVRFSSSGDSSTVEQRFTVDAAIAAITHERAPASCVLADRDMHGRFLRIVGDLETRTATLELFRLDGSLIRKGDIEIGSDGTIRLNDIPHGIILFRLQWAGRVATGRI